MIVYDELSSKLGFPVPNFQLMEHGKHHRFGEKPSKKDCWAVTYSVPNHPNDLRIIYGDFRTGSKFAYCTLDLESMPLNKKNKIIQSFKKQDKEANEELEKKYRLTAKSAKKILTQCSKSEEVHPYLKEKGFNSNYGALITNLTDEENKIYPNNLVIPIYNKDRKISGFQCIWRNYKTDGKKWPRKYLKGLEMVGSYMEIGNPFQSDLVYAVEGYATGLSVHEAMDKAAVICGMNTTGLIGACKTLRKHNPSCKIVFAADNDESMAGEIWAEKASKEVGKSVVKLCPMDKADFNDYHLATDLNTVKESLIVENVEDFYWNSVLNGFTTYSDKGAAQRNQDMLAEYCRDIHNYAYYKRSFHIYEGTHYKPVDDDFIMQFAENSFDSKIHSINSKERMEFLRKCQMYNHVDGDFFSSENKAYLANFQNCVLNLKTHEILDNSPSYGFLNTIPHDYDPFAECPNWDKMMKNFTCDRKHLQDVIEEYIGFILSGMPYDKYNKFLVLAGAGQNGKSTLINIIEHLTGEDSVGSVSLHEASKNRFMFSEMRGKLWNYSEEEPIETFEKTGALKKITGGTSIFAEKKNEQGFKFKNAAKLVISYNEVPKLKDNSHGMKRRFLIVPCDMNLNDGSVELDLDIKNKIFNEAEGIISRCIDAFYRLIDRKDFTHIPESDEKLNQMIEQSDTVYSFINDCIEFTDNYNDNVTAREVLNYYREYIGRSVSQNSFNQRFSKIMKLKFKVESERNRYNGTRSTRYHKIKFIN